MSEIERLREALKACEAMMLALYYPPERRGPDPGYHSFDPLLAQIRAALKDHSHD